MKVKLKKKNGVYHVVVETTTGEKKLVSTRCSDKREARLVAAEASVATLERGAKSADLATRVIGQIMAGKKLTLLKASMAWKEWLVDTGTAPKTAHNYLSVLDSWINKMRVESLPPSAITVRHINKFVNDPDSLTGTGTRNNLLAGLRSFFNFSAAKGWSLGNPAALVKVNMDLLSHEQKETKEVRPFTQKEIEALLFATKDSSDPFWHAAIRISYETGLRLGDICALEWASFENAGRMIVWTDKRDKRVSVPISPELEEFLPTIPITSRHKYLFPARREIIKDPRRRSTLSTQFLRLCASLGIKGKSFHSLRHYRISEWKRQGKTLEDIGELVGHSDTNTTSGYVHQ